MLEDIFGAAVPFKRQRFSNYSMGLALAIVREIKKNGIKIIDLAKALNVSEKKITKYLKRRSQFYFKRNNKV